MNGSEERRTQGPREGQSRKEGVGPDEREREGEGRRETRTLPEAQGNIAFVGLESDEIARLARGR